MSASELDEKALKAAYVAGYDAKGSRRQQVEAAIRAYLAVATAPTVSAKEHRFWTGSKWSEWLPGETPAVIKELFPTWEDRPAPTVSEPLDSQIERLAAFIMTEVPGEPSQSEGAIDCAIRWMRSRLSAEGEGKEA